jgi:hypothetical protein
MPTEFALSRQAPSLAGGICVIAANFAEDTSGWAVGGLTVTALLGGATET